MAVNFNDMSIEDGDIPFEEDIVRNPFNVKSWLRFIDHKQQQVKMERPGKMNPNTDQHIATKIPLTRGERQLNMIFERAVKELPGSYKIWRAYLTERRRQCVRFPVNSNNYEATNNAHERALVFMHKMPRIWIEYIEFLQGQKFITRVRRTFDRCLRALPVTQHRRIWPMYLKFVEKYDIPETGVRVYRRYVKMFPDSIEDFIQYLIKVDRLDEASRILSDVVSDAKFNSKHGKSNHQLWHELCNLISKNPSKIQFLNVEAIIRSGLTRFTDQLGRLWVSLADYYVRSGLYEQARDTYEEAIHTVKTVRDFSQLFDAYTQFEENLLTKIEEEAANPDAGIDDKTVISTLANLDEVDIDIELRLARFEGLMERRPKLLNSVLLRQNPHNCAEWLKRVDLMTKSKDVIDTFTEALKTIEPDKAVGRLSHVWVEFAKYYETAEQLDDARAILNRATTVHYKSVDELADVWCQWAEMEIRVGKTENAINIIRKSVQRKRNLAYFDKTAPPQDRLFRSLKLWVMLADLEESFGSFESCKKIYEQILDIRIATPQLILNYTTFLTENKYYEDSFRVFERSVTLFRWPNVCEIWQTYLTKFVTRYGGAQLERARDLFEQALENCPKKYAKQFYLLYAKLEEDHGLIRSAMNIYSRAIQSCPKDQKFSLFNIYLSRATHFFGVTAKRPIFQQAIDELGDEEALKITLRYACLEQKLGEIDRARSLYAFGSQIANPEREKDFWVSWKNFELEYGNEDTIREMFRLKRSVQALYTSDVNFHKAQLLLAQQAEAAEQETEKEKDKISNLDKMTLLEQQRQGRTSGQTSEAAIAKVRERVLFTSGAQENPDEIGLDEDDDLEDEDDTEAATSKGGGGIETKIIPLEIYGGLKTAEE